MRLYFYNSKLFIWETVVDWKRIVRDIFHPCNIIRHWIVFSFSIDNLQIKFLKKEYPPNESWFGILFLHKILNGSMISMNNNFRINNILPKLITSKHHCQEFLLGSSIILLSTIKCFAGIEDEFNFLSTLCPKTSPTAKSLASHIISKGNFQSGGCTIAVVIKAFLRTLKASLQSSSNTKRNILLEKISEGSRSLRKVFNKSSIETGMTEKTTNTFSVPWIGHPFDSFNLLLVHFNSPLGNLVAKHDPFVNHEVALFPV